MMFEFNEGTYDFFIHEHNNTARNERKVELPLAFHALKILKSLETPIIEIGAVLYSYIDVDHRILDWYEKGDGVENKNIFDVDLHGHNCVSVSTIEHFGRVEHGHDDLVGDDYPLLGLKKIINECDEYFVTWGTGFNREVDEWASQHQDICFCMKDFGGEWKQTKNPDDFVTPYAHSMGRANAFIVATNIL